MRVTYEPGGLLTVVAGDGIAVLPVLPVGGLPDRLVDEVWRSLDARGGIETVLDALGHAFGSETSEPPPFAVALQQGGTVRLAVRGDLRLTVERPGDALELTGGGIDAGNIRLVDDVLSVRVRAAQDAPFGVAHTSAVAELPILSGAVLAASVRAAFIEAADAGGAPGMHGDDAPDASVPDDRTVFPGDTLEPLGNSGPIEPLDILLLDGTPPGDHDGATISATRLDAIRPRAAASAPLDPEPSDPRPSPAARPGRTDPEPATLEPAELLGDHDGVTIAVPHVGAPGGAASSAPVFSAPPPVRARGRIRISTGEVIELGRPVIIGRRPRSTRTTGADMPRLVAVESPQNDISRNHIEITTDGETVVVTDLHTTNGTILHRTGPLGAATEPVRLHPGEHTVVVSGDVVDLGDGVTVAFEDLP